MTQKERRHQTIAAKTRNIVSLPFLVIAHSKLLLAVVVIFGILVGVSVWSRIGPVYDRVRCDIAGWGYLPDGEYHGQLNGAPVTLTLDRALTTEDGRATIVAVRGEDGISLTPLYLFFEHGSIRLHEFPPSFLSCNGDIVKRTRDGEYSVAKSDRYPPWLTFFTA